MKISMTEFREDMSRVTSEIQNGKKVVLTHNKKPIANLIPIEEYDKSHPVNTDKVLDSLGEVWKPIKEIMNATGMTRSMCQYRLDLISDKVESKKIGKKSYYKLKSK